jgi:hypothetical protein
MPWRWRFLRVISTKHGLFFQLGNQVVARKTNLPGAFLQVPPFNKKQSFDYKVVASATMRRASLDLARLGGSIIVQDYGGHFQA